jgi:porin
VLTGDWLGLRTVLAETGITFDADNVQIYQGVASGGLEREFRYGGHGDYVLNVRGTALGLNEGLFLKLRGEHRFGETLANATGALLPPAVIADLPVFDSEDLYLTNVLVTQALSESFAIFAGKMDTLDGDMNAFAHGRGKTQFMNMAFVANPIALRTIPYSTLGAGFVVLSEGEPMLNFAILNATDTARTSGFEELFEEGVALSAELRVPVSLAGLPGHQLIGGTWNSRDYVALGQDPRIVLPDVPINEQSGSWSVYWNFDQYVVAEQCGQELSGWGVFGRAGIADDRTNPLAYFLSFGVGGNSPLANRPGDTFGAGWYYAGTSDEIGPILEGLLGPIGDGQGVELFYNIAVTPWLHLTPDIQVIDPARENADTAFLVGLRGKMDF